MDYQNLREQKEEVLSHLNAEYSSWRSELGLDEARAKTKEEAAARLAANKKAIESGRDHESPYSRKRPPVKNRGPVDPRDPWSAHADDVRAHYRGMQKGGVVKEERKDEKGLTADQKSIGRSLQAGMNPLDDHMSGATRQRLALANRGKKKRRGVKEEVEQVDEAAPVVAAAAKALAPAAKAVAKDVAVSGIKDVGERAKKAIHNKVNPDKVQVEEGLNFEGNKIKLDRPTLRKESASSPVEESVKVSNERLSPEEKATSRKWHSRHEAQYARGAKQHRAAKKNPLRKGEVRKFDKELGRWVSNRD